MPNKTIYVSDDDLPLYKKAQELAGNLSSAISIALRKYVELEEGRLEGYDEITVRVGRGTGRKQRFSGVLLAEGGRSNNTGYEAFKVYRSRTGKFVLHADRRNQFTVNADDERYLTGWRSWIGNWSSDQSWSMAQGEATLQVVETVDELRDLIPEDLYALVEEAANQPAVEDLDI
ncbi:EXLDI protein [Kribbella solani]|uniref:EXLDI family protein n=1 Tax=Kribbella solani TaxID=236067 RepID=A0A841DUX2_9ACTN|nr:EXLDI protein [Kribbella solani]MBB5981889.1 EXLDI family protein [Kribbella solani]MDX2968906.1 EXLDI protein [Kribbella solani]MDX3001333.1 EXLDI protein [Kribbella solani]